MVRIGSYIQITSENENYDKYRRRIWKVSHIARNKHEHPGYDEGIGGLLVSADGLPISLYEWEFEEVDSPRSKKSKGRKGKGWYGDHKGHVEAANKVQAREANNTPMSVDQQNELQWQVQELGLWIDNIYELYKKKVAWFETLWRKYKKGNFDGRKAEKAFAYLTDEAAKHYNKQGFDQEFRIGMQARRIVDKNLVTEFITAAKNKEYDFMR